MVFAGIALAVLAVGLLVVWWFRRPRPAAEPPNTEATGRPGLTRSVVPQIRQLATYSQRLPLFGTRERYAHMIERAALPFELSADEFITIKIAFAVVAVIAALLIHFFVIRSWAIVVAVSFIGLVLPDLQLSAAVRKQEQACLRALPGFLDLLALSVESGMGFDTAVLKLTQILDPGPLTWRFQAYLRSVSVGKTRTEALREMARSLDLPDFTAFASAVIQAAETGASLAPILKTASTDVLNRRFERAEKMAHELPVKILLPLFVFVFPATFLMILVPLYFQLKASGVDGML